MAIMAVPAGLKILAAHICPAGHSQSAAYATSILETSSLHLKQFSLTGISNFTLTDEKISERNRFEFPAKNYLRLSSLKIFQNIFSVKLQYFPPNVAV